MAHSALQNSRENLSLSRLANVGRICRIVECPQIEAQHEEDQRLYLLPNVFIVLKWLKIASLITTAEQVAADGLGWG